MAKAKRKINTKDLVAKIERMSRERMARQKVVDLGAVRRVQEQVEPSTILVIEDDETLRSALKRLFEQDGYRVLAAADGTQLRSVLDDAALDLIIMDVGLPWINGYEIAEMMRAHKDLKHIPLIFISGRNSQDDIKRGFQVGADDFITKPFDIDKIRKTVSTLLKLAERG